MVRRWLGIAGLIAVLGLPAPDAFAASPAGRPSVPGHSGGRPSSSWSGGGSHYPHHYVPVYRYPHFSTRVVVVPSYGPAWRYAPVVAYPPAALPVYAAPPPPPEGYWYYCPDSRQYYPYVGDCASGWLAMAPGVPGPN